METPHEFAESQVRRFLMVLLTTRAERHLQTLAEHYGWSPETLAARREQFIKPSSYAPIFQEK